MLLNFAMSVNYLIEVGYLIDRNSAIPKPVKIEFHRIVGGLVHFENGEIDRKFLENLKTLMNSFSSFCFSNRELLQQYPIVHAIFLIIRRVYTESCISFYNTQDRLRLIEKRNLHALVQGQPDSIHEGENPALRKNEGECLAYLIQNEDPRVGDGCCNAFYLKWAFAFLQNEHPFGIDPNTESVKPNPLHQLQVISLDAEILAWTNKTPVRPGSWGMSLLPKKPNKQGEIPQAQLKIILEQNFRLIEKYPDDVFNLILEADSNPSSHIFGIKPYGNYIHILDANLHWRRFKKEDRNDMFDWLVEHIYQYSLKSHFNFTHLNLTSTGLWQIKRTHERAGRNWQKLDGPLKKGIAQLPDPIKLPETYFAITTPENPHKEGVAIGHSSFTLLAPPRDNEVKHEVQSFEQQYIRAKKEGP